MTRYGAPYLPSQNVDNFVLPFNTPRSTYGPSLTLGGLVVYLDAGQAASYPGSGTSWNDLSGQNNNATLINGASYESANGGAILFDGSNDYASVSSSNDFAFGTGDFTLEVWIYPQSFSTYTHMLALPSQSTFALKANVTDGAIYFYSPSYNTYGSTSGWTLSLNQWNHVVFKRENSVGYAFLNNIEKGSKSGFTNSFSAQTLNIHNGYPNEFTACKMSVVRIYNKALSSSEIAINFDYERSRYGL